MGSFDDQDDEYHRVPWYSDFVRWGKEGPLWLWLLLAGIILMMAGI